MTGTFFELWRQDDNGQRFLIGRHPIRAAAERQLTKLSRAAHKQAYWIDEVPEIPERLEQH